MLAGGDAAIQPEWKRSNGQGVERTTERLDDHPEASSASALPEPKDTPATAADQDDGGAAQGSELI